MRTRELVCTMYTCEGGVCEKRGIPCHFNKELQHCSKYIAKAGARPRRTDNRKKKLERINKKEFRNEI